MTLRAPGAALPVDEILAQLERALQISNRVVLQAPPGAGKSTRVPLALLGAGWLDARKVIVLEPRRLAARAIAQYAARLLGEEAGDTVGFRMRGESRIGARTRVEIVTEGVLTRMVLDDPVLEAYGVVVFDEFHERSLHADLGLALCLQTQEILRPDLRVLIMSATIDTGAIATMLGNAPVITSRSRSHAVEVRYVPPAPGVRVEDAMAGTIRRALTAESGGLLAFLPGAGEIRRCLEVLEAGRLPEDVRMLPLYGDLPLDAQDAAVRPGIPGERKVVLATSIAETSLTIEDIRIVVDSGLARVSRFAPRTGMARLETIRVSRASADQRAGRAGRVAPGVCFRLWAAEEHAALAESARPEILEADLASLALDLAAAGVADSNALRWLDEPPAKALRHARTLLRELDAIDDNARMTAHGKRIAVLGVHPRLAHMLVVARDEGFGATACAVAALLEERDILRRAPSERDPDLRLRLELVSHVAPQTSRIRARISALRGLVRVPRNEALDEFMLGAAVALAFPDRLAQRRTTAGRYRLRNGIGASLPGEGALSRDEFLAVAELDGRSPDATIFLAAPLDRETMMRLFAHQVEHADVIEWNATSDLVTSTRQDRLGALILREGRIPDPDAQRVVEVLLEAIRRGNLQLRWTSGAQRLRERVAFLRSRDSTWPDWSDEALRASCASWLGPHLTGLRRQSQIDQLSLADLLLGSLDWERRRDLDHLAPTHIAVPSGSRVPVDYSMPESPRIAVRLQEMFGLEATPMLANGTVPLTIELLSPAHRPVQVTSDLAGFWRTSYFAVRKELRGRYPRHEWPEDPLRALPTRRTKPRN